MWCPKIDAVYEQYDRKCTSQYTEAVCLDTNCLPLLIILATLLDIKQHDSIVTEYEHLLGNGSVNTA
jgi:hypothetical protein